jgi:heme/copper-type cytochrome/quinol oxidase subunit 2
MINNAPFSGALFIKAFQLWWIFNSFAFILIVAVLIVSAAIGIVCMMLNNKKDSKGD